MIFEIKAFDADGLKSSRERKTGEPTISREITADGTEAYGAMLRYALLETIWASGKTTGLDLSGADLSGLDLVGINFGGCSFFGTNFKGADLRGCNFSGADMTHTNVAGAIIDKGAFDGADLVGTSLGSADERGP